MDRARPHGARLLLQIPATEAVHGARPQGLRRERARDRRELQRRDGHGVLRLLPALPVVGADRAAPGNGGRRALGGHAHCPSQSAPPAQMVAPRAGELSAQADPGGCGARPARTGASWKPSGPTRRRFCWRTVMGRCPTKRSPTSSPASSSSRVAARPPGAPISSRRAMPTGTGGRRPGSTTSSDVTPTSSARRARKPRRTGR